MENKENLKRVFTGSVIEAQFVKSYLKDNNINALLRNTLNESMIAGWASGAPGDSGLIFVFEGDFDKAMVLIHKLNNETM